MVATAVGMDARAGCVTARKIGGSEETPVALSLSGGGSSFWILLAVLRGIIPRPKWFAVFFADTGEEHEWTYETVDEAEEICRNEGIDFIRCGRDRSLGDHLLSIKSDGLTRADHPPVYIAKPDGRGQAAHRCTREFKIAPMRRAQSAWLKRNGHPKRITKWIGFGADEVPRALKSEAKRDVAWEGLAFPAIRCGVVRAEQHRQLRQWLGHDVRFSMCTICPWKDPARWLATPARQLERVYRIDESIRDLSGIGLTDGDAYLCDRLIPVRELVEKGDPQPALPGMESYCDGGHCFL